MFCSFVGALLPVSVTPLVPKYIIDDMKEIPYDLGREHCFQSNGTEMTVETESGEVVAKAVDLQTTEDWIVVDFDIQIAWYVKPNSAKTRIDQIASEAESLEIVGE